MKPLKTLLPPDAVLAYKGCEDSYVTGVTQSTQDLEAGRLFFAIKGTKADGHDRLEEVVAGGAIPVVERVDAFEKLTQGVLVASTRQAVGEAASRWFNRPTKSIQLVGITGTNGKTTSAFLLNGVWEAAGISSGLIGTVEYRLRDEVLPAPLTTPDALTLQSLLSRMRAKDVTHAVMEVSSIALDQSRLAGCDFEVALFTNLTPDHLDYHGSMEQYLEAKRALFRDYPLGAAVLNADDPASKSIREVCRAEVFTYGLKSAGADFSVETSEFSAQGIRAQIQTPEGQFELVSPLMGAHNLSNCLGVLAVQYALAGDIEATLEALSHHPGAPGRLERVAAGASRPHIFVDYAHTEDALRNVLESLRRVRGDSPGKILTVFGCGGDRDREKRPRMGAVAAELSDVVIATSDNPRTEDPDAILDAIETGMSASREKIREADRRKAIGLALERAEPGDIVLIAGKGHETYQILGEQKVPFDDRRVIRDYYGV